MKDNTDHFVCRLHFLSNSRRKETCGNILLGLYIACEHCILGSNNLAISSAKRSETKTKQIEAWISMALVTGGYNFLLLEWTETLSILQLVFYTIAEPSSSKHWKRCVCIIHWITINNLTTLKSFLPRRFALKLLTDPLSERVWRCEDSRFLLSWCIGVWLICFSEV